MWFVAKKSSCGDNDSSDEENLLDVSEEKNYERFVEYNLYPNPFEDYFIVSSQEDDIFILQSIEGTLIGEYIVSKGENRIAENLSNGVYIGRLRSQGHTFKIVKQ